MSVLKPSTWTYKSDVWITKESSYKGYHKQDILCPQCRKKVNNKRSSENGYTDWQRLKLPGLKYYGIHKNCGAKIGLI